MSFSLGFLTGLGAQAGYLLVSFPAGILVARLLGPEGKGAVDLAVLAPFLMVTFANLGLPAAGSYLIGSRKLSQIEIIGTLAGLWALVSAILTPVYGSLATLGWLGPLAPGVPAGLLLAGMLLIPLGLGQQYFGSVLLGQQRFIAYNGAQIILAVVRLAGIVLFVWTLRRGAMGAVTAAVVAHGIVVLYLLLSLRESWDFRPRLSKPVIRTALAYGLRSQIGNVFQFFNYRLDVIILGHYWSLREVGLYTLAVSLAEFLWYIPNSSAQVIFPRTAASSEEARSLTPLVFRLTGAMTVAGAAALAAMALPLIVLLYGAAFRGSAPPLYWLLPGVVCLGGTKVLSADLNGRGLPGINAVSALLSLCVTLSLDFLLIPGHGAIGAAWASSAAYLCSLVYTFIAYLRVVGSRPWAILRFADLDREALRGLFRRAWARRPGARSSVAHGHAAHPDEGPVEVSRLDFPP